MPLRTQFISYDKNVTYELSQAAEKDGVVIFEDRSKEIIRYIIGVCLDRGDIGADIHVISREEFFRRSEIGGDQILDRSTFKQEIYPGFPYTEKIIDWEGERGLLVIQHVGENGFTQSYN